ncbi:phosphatase PAP2 family protein [Streptomyces sp. NPDC058427]|uniref:acid phosphatase n=1 Tax=Streptomyces sp. NPDC058427 TaxID=3346494 RepID=UPI0036650FFE
MSSHTRSRRKAAVIAVSLLTVLTGVRSAGASAVADDAPALGGYWSTSYEAGAPQPAGFPAYRPATGLRGETTRVSTTVTSVISNQPNDGSTTEHVASLADNDSSTKWYASGSGQPTADHPLYAIYTLESAAPVTGYSLTSGNDAPPRDPRAWTVFGSNRASAASDADDPSWTALDSEKDQEFGARNQTGFYPVGTPGSYRYYQLRVTGNCAEHCTGSTADRTKFQLADWTLRSDAGTRPSALGLSVEDAQSVGAAAGTGALRYAGRLLKSGAASSTVVMRSGLDVPLGPDSALSYAIRPTDDASAHATVDVVYTDADGRHTRRLHGRPTLRDTAGRATGTAPDSSSPTPGVWNTMSVELGSLAGKRVTDVLLSYDNPAAKAGSTVSGWVDAVELGKRTLDTSTSWSYLDTPDVDPAGGATDRTAWTQPGFDSGEGPWKTATGAFGVKGEGTDLGKGFPVGTKLNLKKGGSPDTDIEAYFFRTSFTLDRSAIDAMTGLVGSIVYDDTATVYLNGKRVAGWNDSHITRNLQYETEDGTDGGGDPAASTFTIPASSLRAGSNTLAVEVHQCNGTSSDAYFGLPYLEQTDASLPFTDSRLNTTYASDVLPTAPNGGDYFTELLHPFTKAASTPGIMGANTVLPEGTTYDQLTALNDKTVVRINNAYPDRTDPQVQKALVDGANSPYRTMADGLGEAIGPLYTQALRNGELPKTNALLSGRVEHTPTSSADWYQTAKNNYQYKRPFVRMGFTNDSGLIEQWDSPGGYAGLEGDGSFPSGHTSHAYAQGIVMATLLPQLAPQILARTSEYANNRIVLAFHYPTDIMGGRIVGADTAQMRWSDPRFRTLLEQAGTELRSVLTQKCHEAGRAGTLAECAAGASPYLSTDKALSVYRQRMTYGYPQVGTTGLDPSVPPGAENLLITAFPGLSAAQRRTVLAATEIPSGYVMDQEDGTGSWQRLDLAAAMAARVTVGRGGSLTVNGVAVDADGLPHHRPGSAGGE